MGIVNAPPEKRDALDLERATVLVYPSAEPLLTVEIDLNLLKSFTTAMGDAINLLPKLQHLVRDRQPLGTCLPALELLLPPVLQSLQPSSMQTMCIPLATVNARALRMDVCMHPLVN